ncbi:toxin secretion/phage lysis holin [Aequitasia blattaphilus]|uniref:Phage holin family protein n=1 Tax=Aequitasia blattaphilus TaxID=2949332 RepID=A0ABT1E9U9_9FIRM|nr:phage holin family protein [Aequitasia blattaphilus]MCP1102600.1 phage holin family protein [Aequitasia blattaphilus]MCR8615240.1 phage holin family protein [Aequitasia blattaphilus]
MKKMDKIKILVTSVLAFVSSMLGVLFVPVCLLVLCNVIDYVTGLWASPSRDEKISSYKSMKGIVKKVCMWLLVVVGAILDQLIIYAVATAGYRIPFDFAVACIVAIWLICNELISILENIGDIGTPLPPFLLKLVKYVQDQTESKIETTDNQEHP